MNEVDFLLACPFCRDICNCKSCLRLELREKNETRISEEAKKHYSKYLLRRLLPFVKQIDVEQSLEKEMEAQIRGLPLSDVKVQQADCCDDERLNCNNCGTSIADYHRSCTKCPYDLCISCCRDLRAGSLHAGHMGSMNQYKNPGVGYLHGETCKPRNNRTVGTSTATKDGGPRKAKLPEWRPNKDGSISCPPESLGGCGGKGILRLNQVFQDGWLSDVILKAEDLCQLYNLDGMPEDPTHGCSCYNLAVDETATKTIRKAASRDRSDDNYLYSPSSGDIQAGDRKHFQAHWSKGEPVIVTGVLDSTYGLSWEPMVMSRAMHDKSHTRVTVLNCLNWCKEEYSLSSFFKGYTEGKLDLSGWPQMLKLNDWPPSGSFEDHLPRHNVEFLSALPFKEYTHPQSGYLNLAIKLPECHLKPDTGPKLYAAYGFSQQLGRGDSVSKLSYHDSDAVYVLTHVKEMTFTPSELAKMEQLKEKHRVQDEREIYVEGEMGNGPEPQREGNDTEELQNPESGALWDIYRREDAFKLKEYLRKHFREFRHTYCLPLKQVVDPIYDGAFYLNAEHQRRLKEEYGIEPWSVVQNLGDAIFIPAGCPFQVRNFKSCIQVSTGFVSPESIHECLRFTEEIRALPLKRVAKEDKLGVKKLIIYAIRQVLNDLEEITKSETMTDCLDIHSDSLVESGYMMRSVQMMEMTDLPSRSSVMSMERKTQELIDLSSGMESSRKRKQQLYQLFGSDSSDSSTSKDTYKPRRHKTGKNGSGCEQKYYCHQCKRNDKDHVVTCSRCEKKRYCTSCILKNYPQMNEVDFLLACPFCRDICNCKSCLRLELREKNETRISEEAKKHYSKYLLRRLLPFVKQIDVEQSLEKEMEAQIRGLPLSDVEVQQADCCDDERLNCNNCGTSIADYHRSCTKCPYDLCISCCRDLRAGSLHAGHMGSMNQYKNPGVGYLHGETCKPRSNRTVGTSTATKDGGPRKAKLPEWRPNKDGSISCPPESLGGCGGKGILRLNQVFQDGWLSDVILKAEDLCQLYNLDGMPEDPTHGCSCYNLAVDETATKTIRKAASRDRSDDNYLYSPSSGDIQAGDRKHFQAHWSKGEPVIVTGVLDSTYGLSWEPMVMSRAMHDKSHTRVTVLNCLNWCKEEYSLSSFFKGYTEGKLDLSGWPQMLKLNDWPPSGSFEDHLPRHNVEFLSALPFKEYTHPQSGYLNLAIKLPECHLKPDTGPKLYAAYGFSQQLRRGDSVSKLSYHDSDAVYVLTHVKEMTFTPSELAKMEQLKEKHRVQDEREIYVEGEMGNGPEPQREGNDTEELQNPESGALWDIYRREDAFKLKEYLRKHFREFRHTYCLPLKQEKKNCENLEESAGQDEEITNLDFEAHGPNPLVGRTGRTRKSAKKQSENIGHTHSEDLEKMRKEIAAEMDDKMNKKLRKILGRLAEMNPTLNVNVEELCGETDGSDDEDDGEENDKDDDAEGDGNGSANDEDDEVGSDDGDDSA
ncbi:hypothetical protein ACET3Z_017192 [Daucus carota]